MFSSLLGDSSKVKSFVRVKEFMLPFEYGAKKLYLEGEDQPNLFVLAWLIREFEFANRLRVVSSWARCVSLFCESTAP